MLANGLFGGLDRMDLRAKDRRGVSVESRDFVAVGRLEDRSATLARFDVAKVVDGVWGTGTTASLLLGLVSTCGVAFSTVSVIRTVTRGRQRAFDPRRGVPWG